MGIVGGGDTIHGGNAIGDGWRRLIDGGEGSGPASGNLGFGYVAEGMVAEVLSPDGSAIRFGDAREVIGVERTGLRVCRIEGIDDAESPQAAVSVPTESSSDGLGADLELVAIHAERVGVVGENVRVSGAESHLVREAGGVAGRGGCRGWARPR